MDPTVCLRTLVDTNATVAERHEAARDLLTWLYSGGFMPPAWLGSREDLITFCKRSRSTIAQAGRLPQSPRPNPPT
jgi:hypothetical protein